MFAVVEIMGHRTRAGVISDSTLGGAALLRIEHPTRAATVTSGDVDVDEPLTEYYAPQAIFAIRPCSREEAEKIAAWAWPAERPAQGALPPAFDELVDDENDWDDE